MKSWFPFTDYEFYAYLTSGMLLIAAVDYTMTGGVLVNRTDWTVVDGVFWGAMAYLAGHILAIPSAVLLEHFLARTILRPPVTVLLELKPRRWLERMIAWVFGIREYRPMPYAVRSAINSKICNLLGVSQLADPEEAFQVIFPHARSVSDCATRLDTFINQYGFARNVSFAAICAAILLWREMTITPTPQLQWLLLGAIALAVGFFLRFIKFYAAYAAEALRTFNKVAP